MTDTAAARRHGVHIDLFVAIVLAVILTVGWTLNDWLRLSRMLLPDPDDMMRLAQVRDWLAGQGINDWTQYRMAPPQGSPMHWSRINDAGIAALILAAAPLVGSAKAEMFAVLVYPGLLFACVMFLSARIGRRLWGAGAGSVAAVLTALAYPGTTVFIPGRIDHHALQVVLIELLVLLLMRPASSRGGIAAGTLAGLSLIVGLETAPQVTALVAVLSLLWVVQGAGERARLGGFAAGLAGSTLSFLALLRPTLWTSQLCDAFTPASAAAALAVSAGLAMLTVAAPRLKTWQLRLGLGAIAGCCALGATLLAYPSCINGPYGEMDPFLLQAFMPYIDEANSIFDQPRIARLIAIGGMMTTAVIVTIWMLIRERARWTTLLPLASVVLISALVLLFQVRGAYIGAPLAAPMLASLVVLARRRTTWRAPAVIGAWLAGAGMVYATIPEQIELRTGGETHAVNRPTLQVVCSAGDTWHQVDQLPPGVMMAGASVAAYVIGATHHATVGAGYHRNNRGNMAMYRFFLGPPSRSRAIARAWDVDYVIFCPGDFSEIDVTRTFPGSIAAQLETGRTPTWLDPIPLEDSALRVYRVR